MRWFIQCEMFCGPLSVKAGAAESVFLGRELKLTRDLKTRVAWWESELCVWGSKSQAVAQSINPACVHKLP